MMVRLNTGEWMLWPQYFVLLCSLDTEYVTLYILHKCEFI